MKKIACAFLLSAYTSLSFAASEWISPSTDDAAKNMADVVKSELISHQNMSVRLFSYTGGDAAMNGLLLNLAVFNHDRHQWNVYALANVANYNLLPTAKEGYLKIATTIDHGFDDQGNITQQKAILFINYTQADKNNGRIQIENVVHK